MSQTDHGGEAGCRNGGAVNDAIIQVEGYQSGGSAAGDLSDLEGGFPARCDECHSALLRRFLARSSRLQLRTKVFRRTEYCFGASQAVLMSVLT